MRLQALNFQKLKLFQTALMFIQVVEDTVSLGKIFHIKWESKLKYFRYCDCFALQCIEQ